LIGGRETGNDEYQGAHHWLIVGAVAGWLVGMENPGACSIQSKRKSTSGHVATEKSNFSALGGLCHILCRGSRAARRLRKSRWLY
jgi:hypothetical protein